MDETIINKDIKNYTWLVKGTSGSIKNIHQRLGKFDNDNLQRGVNYSDATNRNTNLKVLAEFLKELLQKIRSYSTIQNPSGVRQCTVSPSIDCDRLFRIQWNYIFVPPEAPELAPVEKILTQLKGKII